MKNTITFLLTFFCLSISAQIKFEKGYIINNENQKIECLIKNPDWSSIPNEIEYKMTEFSATEKATIYDITGFKIYNTDHYYKKNSFSFDENENDKSENIKRITSFLKVLVEGEANLYEYKGYTFLYEINSGEIKQLVYKKYKNQENRMYQDFAFRKELYNNLNCKENKTNIRLLKYSRIDLINYFKSYNICKNSEFEVFIPKKTKAKFNFKILAGANFYSMKSNLTLVSMENVKVMNYKSSSVNSIFGFETELILPFNQYKWSIFIAPNYQYQKQEASERITKDLFGGYNGSIELKENYSYIDLPIGIRKYIYINDKSKIYFDGSYSFIDYINKSNDKAFYPDFEYQVPLKVSNKNTQKFMYTAFRIGTGFSFKDKYYLSLNYSIKKLSQSDINSISILASYKLF